MRTGWVAAPDEAVLGYVATVQGDFDAAMALLRRAIDPLARTGYSWGPLALTLLAQALGQQGDQLEAAKVFSRAQSQHGLKSTLFGPELALAKAWSEGSCWLTPARWRPAIPQHSRRWPPTWPITDCMLLPPTPAHRPSARSGSPATMRAVRPEEEPDNRT